jgi:hypothetical protein
MDGLDQVAMGNPWVVVFCYVIGTGRLDFYPLHLIIWLGLVLQDLKITVPHFH